MSLLGKPEWPWRNWRWTRRKTSTCASRELSQCVRKLNYSQATFCYPCLNQLLTRCNLAAPNHHRQREPQQPAEPEASLSMRMRQGLLLVTSADPWPWSSFTTFKVNHFSCVESLPSRGKMAERQRSAVGFWCPSCTAPRPTASWWEWCAVFTWLPWMPTATLTPTSKCRLKELWASQCMTRGLTQLWFKS